MNFYTSETLSAYMGDEHGIHTYEDVARAAASSSALGMTLYFAKSSSSSPD
jgi:hypothetical protein